MMEGAFPKSTYLSPVKVRVYSNTLRYLASKFHVNLTRAYRGPMLWENDDESLARFCNRGLT